MAFAPVFPRPFPATFDRRAATTSNGLLNALIAYWPGNEASGDLQDAHTNALHLTDTNTVTNAAGKVYATARQYTAANDEYHTRNNEALLEVLDVDFTIAAWVYFDDLSTNPQAIASKQNDGPGDVLSLRYNVGKGQGFFFSRSYPFSPFGVAEVKAISFGNAAINTWYLVICWHDYLNNLIGISINDTVDTVGCPLTGDSSSPFVIGKNSIGGKYTGRIGPVAMWKSSAGNGGVLSSVQRTALYAGGAGLAYAQFTT